MGSRRRSLQRRWMAHLPAAWRPHSLHAHMPKVKQENVLLSKHVAVLEGDVAEVQHPCCHLCHHCHLCRAMPERGTACCSAKRPNRSEESSEVP